MIFCEALLSLETQQKNLTQKKKEREKVSQKLFKERKVKLSQFSWKNLSLSIFQSEFLKINRKIGNCKIFDGRLETPALLYYSLYSQSNSIFEDQQKTLLRRQAWKTLEALLILSKQDKTFKQLLACLNTCQNFSKNKATVTKKRR